MDYEQITDVLLGKIIEEFKMEEIYQEFIDSLVKFDDYKNVTNKKIQSYLDKIEFKKKSKRI